MFTSEMDWTGGRENISYAQDAKTSEDPTTAGERWGVRETRATHNGEWNEWNTQKGQAAVGYAHGFESLVAGRALVLRQEMHFRDGRGKRAAEGRSNVAVSSYWWPQSRWPCWRWRTTVAGLPT